MDEKHEGIKSVHHSIFSASLRNMRWDFIKPYKKYGTKEVLFEYVQNIFNLVPFIKKTSSMTLASNSLSKIDGYAPKRAQPSREVLDYRSAFYLKINRIL